MLWARRATLCDMTKFGRSTSTRTTDVIFFKEISFVKMKEADCFWLDTENWRPENYLFYIVNIRSLINNSLVWKFHSDELIIRIAFLLTEKRSNSTGCEWWGFQIILQSLTYSWVRECYRMCNTLSSTLFNWRHIPTLLLTESQNIPVMLLLSSISANSKISLLNTDKLSRTADSLRQFSTNKVTASPQSELLFLNV